MSRAHRLPLHHGAPWVSPLAKPSAPAWGMQVGVTELLADGEGLGQREDCVVGKCCCSAGASRGSVMLPVPLSATAGFASGWAREARWLGSPCQHSLTTPSPDVSPMDAVSAGTQKDELTLRIVVRMLSQLSFCISFIQCHSCHPVSLQMSKKLDLRTGSCSASP